MCSHFSYTFELSSSIINPRSLQSISQGLNQEEEKYDSVSNSDINIDSMINEDSISIGYKFGNLRALSNLSQINPTLSSVPINNTE